MRFWNQPVLNNIGAFDGAQTHDLNITSQTCNPLRHAAH